MILAAAGLTALLVTIGCGDENDPFSFVSGPVYRVGVFSPADGATGVSTRVLVSVSFPTPLDPDTVGPHSFVLQDAKGRAVSVEVIHDAAAHVVTLRPLYELAPYTRYMVVVSGVRSSDGIEYAAATSGFITGAGASQDLPQVVSHSPLPNQEEVPLNASITLRFSASMDRTSVERAFRVSEGLQGTFSWSSSDTVLTFSPTGTLSYDTWYEVTLTTEATDVEGRPLASGVSFRFHTKREPTFAVISSVPSDGSVSAPADVAITFTFSSPVDRSTVVTSFSIDPPMTIDESRFSYSNNDQIVIYTPPSLLSAGTVVRTTWAETLSSTDGETLRQRYELTFSIETNAPYVVDTDPDNGATQVAADTAVRFYFSERLDPASVDSSTFQVMQGGAVPGTITLENDDRTVVFTPATPYTSGTPVVVTATTGIRDIAGTAVATDVSISFTIDTQPPQLTYSYPADGATQVPVDDGSGGSFVMTFIFDEPLDSTQTQSSVAVSPALTSSSINWPSPTRMTIVSNELLRGATDYLVSFTMYDLAGNSAPASVSFRTDDTPPVVNTVSPATGASNVPVDTTVELTFSERMNEDSVREAFTLSYGSTVLTQYDGTLVVDTVGTAPNLYTHLSFTPSSALPSGESVTIGVSTTAADLAGNHLAADYSSSFVTAD